MEVDAIFNSSSVGLYPIRGSNIVRSFENFNFEWFDLQLLYFKGAAIFKVLVPKLKHVRRFSSFLNMK